jgi:Tol biopolymer transport system component
VVQQSTEIYAVRPDGADLRRVIYGNVVAGSFSWSLDGSSIAFYEADFEQRLQRGQGTTQIVSIDFKTGQRDVLTSGRASKLSPQWLVKGRVGYVARRTGDSSFSQNSSGTLTQDGSIRFVSGSGGASGAFDSPHWSPDGTRVVFHRTTDLDPVSVQEWPRPDSRFGLVRVGLSFPSYSPAGDRLTGDENLLTAKRVFVANADGTQRRVIHELESSEPCHQTTAHCASVQRPVWSPRETASPFRGRSHGSGRPGPSGDGSPRRCRI